MTEKIFNLPEVGELVKFVQLYINDKPYLMCGEEGECHSRILEKVLKKFNLDFEMIESKSRRGEMVPSPEGKNYKVVGMGKTKFSLEFFEKSGDYNMEPSNEHLERIRPYLATAIEVKIK